MSLNLSVEDDASMKSIDEIVELTGSSLSAIFHYQSLGLIPSPQQGKNPLLYSSTDIHMIRIITQLQEAGFRPEELAALHTHDQPERPVNLANKLIDLKREQLRQEMDELIVYERQLLDLKETLRKRTG